MDAIPFRESVGWERVNNGPVALWAADETPAWEIRFKVDRLTGGPVDKGVDVVAFDAHPESDVSVCETKTVV